MNKDKIIVFLLLGFAFLFVGASALYNFLGDKVEPESLVVENPSSDDNENSEEDSSTEDKETAKQKAPNITVFDLEGNAVYLADFKGKPTILNFWASWCGPCKSEMPYFEEAYQQYKDEINFMFINITDGSRDTVEKASSYIENQGYTFPVYYDTTLSASFRYNTNSIPVTYFIDSEGNIAAWVQGALNKTSIQRGIDTIYTTPQS